MKQSRGLSYAAILAAAFLLWLPVALFGGQGYSVLLALAAMPALAYAPLLRVNRLAVIMTFLAVWFALTSLWSPETGKVVTGGLADGDFSLNAASLRVLLTTLAGILVLAAMLRVRRVPCWAAWVTGGVLALHGLVTLLTGLLPGLTLDIYAPFSDPVKEAPQNILRSANAYSLALPLLMGFAWSAPPRWRIPATAAILFIALASFFLVGSDVALAGSILLIACLVLVHFLPVNGLRILLGALAVFIAVSPVVLSQAGPALARSDLPIPDSARSRIWAWQLAADKIAERPLFGHGIEASKEWRETFGDEPDLLALMEETTQEPQAEWEKYRILPGHPHNMGLQLWAETGAVGVALAVAALLLLAWQLPPPAWMHPATALAVTGLVATAAALFNLSYSLWNEAFWASLALVAAGIVLLDKVAKRR